MVITSFIQQKLGQKKNRHTIKQYIVTFLYGFFTLCIIKACSSTSWWKYNEKNSSVKQKVNLRRLPPSQVQEMKRGMVNSAAALAARRQEARATAVEAFDVRVLINEDYGLCACVSPDLSTNARRRWLSQKTSRQNSSWLESKAFWTILSASI